MNWHCTPGNKLAFGTTRTLIQKRYSWSVAFVHVNIHSEERIGEGHIRRAVLMGRADVGLYLVMFISKS